MTKHNELLELNLLTNIDAFTGWMNSVPRSTICQSCIDMDDSGTEFMRALAPFNLQTNTITSPLLHINNASL